MDWNDLKNTFQEKMWSNEIEKYLIRFFSVETANGHQTDFEIFILFVVPFTLYYSRSFQQLYWAATKKKTKTKQIQQLCHQEKICLP